MKKAWVILALLLLAAPGVLSAQEQSTTLSFGYQWVTLSGSEDTYRSQVDEDDGLVLDDLRLRLAGGGWFDVLSLSASGFGGSPTGSLRLTVAQRQAYRLSLNYHRGRRVFALLDFANPLLGSGVTPGQHTADGVLDRLDVNVELFPGKTITPLFAYRYVRDRASGTTTVHLGEDEFLLGGSTFDRTHEFEAGVGVHLGFLDAVVLQGWRNRDGESRFALFPGAGQGNSRRPVLDHDVTLSSFARKSTYATDAPYTTAVVSARVAPFARISGRYVYQDTETDSRLSEQAAGSLVAFKLERFFQRFAEDSLGEAKAPNWRGEGKVELSLPAGFSLTASYLQRHRELSGWSLVQDAYLGSVSFSGYQGGDITKLFSARTGIVRDEKETSGVLSSPSFGPVSLWASFGTAKQEFTISPDAREIVVPGNQGGFFARQVDRIGAGATVTAGPVLVALDYTKDDADKVVVRTDVTSRKRLRARAQIKLGIVELGASGEKLDAESDVPENGYDLSGKDWTAEIRLNPTEALSLWGSYGKFKTDSSIAIRRPEDFSLASSLYHEDGSLAEGGVSYRTKAVTGEASYSKIENEGSRGLCFERVLARLEVPLEAGFGVGFEASRATYEQTGFALADYTAKRYLFLLRYQH